MMMTAKWILPFLTLGFAACSGSSAQPGQSGVVPNPAPTPRASDTPPAPQTHLGPILREFFRHYEGHWTGTGKSTETLPDGTKIHHDIGRGMSVEKVGADTWHLGGGDYFDHSIAADYMTDYLVEEDELRVTDGDHSLIVNLVSTDVDIQSLDYTDTTPYAVIREKIKIAGNHLHMEVTRTKNGMLTGEESYDLNRITTYTPG